MRLTHTPFAALLLAGSALIAGPATAQGYPATATQTDADRLADAVRRVGAAPRDLNALIEAGELSVEVGDATAAAAFFKRAEQIDPNNGRVKAGIARILVAGEHPGEALRYFDQAERSGLSMAPYAADRGLAYDLIGQQGYAQRDYRRALRQGDDDELRRRYALSLGISGQRDEALKEIDALLRRSDRGAWRARAFILAMNGDVAGANKIATSMMPGMAAGLAGFFQRLPTLSAADRAFAVHFGEVTATPARLADAQLAPRLAPLVPERTQVATVTPTPAPVQTATNTRGYDRSRDRDRRRGTVAPVTVAPVVASRPATASVTPQPAYTPTPPPSPVVSAALGNTPPVLTPRPTTPAPAPAPTIVASRPPLTATPVTTAPPAYRPPATTPTQVATAIPAPTPTAPAPVTVASASPTPAPAAVRPATPATPATPPRGDGDSILARIVANITVPASELDVAPPPARPGAAKPATASGSLDRAARNAQRNVAAQRATEEPATKPLTAAERRAKALADRKAKEAAAAEEPAPKVLTAAERRAKALADRKAKEEAAAKKLAADKAAAEKKAARAEPARYWVQVAGGANQRDLGRAWADVQKKAPALAGKKAYTTPLRATNRVVTGPYKTEAEARAMVNTLAKQGLSAFTFASEAGQKIKPLGGK